MSRIARYSFIGLIAGVVLSFHALAVPTSAGACAEASLHHAPVASVADGFVADAGEQSVETLDAQVGRDLRAPQSRSVSVHLLPAQDGELPIVRYCFNPAPPDRSELSLWRT